MTSLLKFLPVAVVIALAVLTGTASATALCKNESNPCNEKYGAGTELKLSLEGTWRLHPPIGEIECAESSLTSKVENAGGVGVTVSGAITTLTFSKCNATVSVLKKGNLIHHTLAGTKMSTTTWEGGEITVEFSGFHCIFNSGTGVDLGTQTTGLLRRFHWNSTLPRTGGRSGAFCGSTAQSTAEYGWTSPSPAYWSES